MRICYPSSGYGCSSSGARGFTLVELMVGLALSSIVLFALVALFGNNSRVRNQIDRAAQQIENGRYALELMRDDLHLAGYYGSVVPQASYQPATAVAPTIVELCSSALASLHFTRSPLQWPVPVYGIAAGDPVPACVSSATGGQKAGTDILVVRRTRTLPAAAQVANEIYIQGSGCGTELLQKKDFVVDVGGAGTFVLNKQGCAALSDVYRVETRIYYVSNETVPTLRLLTLSGVTSTNEPLVEGIEDLRIDYGLDTGSDGAADVYRKCKLGAGVGTDPCSTTEWANMMAVRVNILTRDITTTPGYSDTKTYVLGTANVGPFNDGYRRHEYGTVVRMMNPAGRREL
jgi:type IV pilus assembly protein PilW